MSDCRKNLTSPGGDVRTLLTFRKAVIIYDLTFHFAHTFLDRTDRTVDQMIQAARSGKQNIAESSAAGVTSMETAIKLTNVAKASFLELLLDYEDFLRVRGFWQKPARRKPSPTWRSSFCIRKTICCRRNSMRWSGSSSPAAASVSDCLVQG